jgi:adenylate cyclase
MGARRGGRKTAALLIVVVVAAGVGVLARATGVLERSELQTIDARFAIRGNRRPPSNIVFVQISLQAEQELERRRMVARLPLPRRYDAQVIDRLRRAGAAVIAMDMEYIHETNPREDNELIEAVGRAYGKVVLATVNVTSSGGTQIFGGSPRLLNEIGARAAEVHLTLARDGVVRRFAREYSHLASFPVVAAEVMTGQRVAASTFDHGTLPIDFVGPPGVFDSISFARVMRGDFPVDEFQGKLVIVGASSPILQDLHATATGATPMPGPEIWANAATTLLAGAPLRDAPGWLDVLLILVLGAVVPLSSMRLRRWRSLLDALALALVFSVGVQVAFDSGLIVTYVYPLLALAVGTLGTLAVLYMVETIERARVHDLFARFVPADVVDQVVASAGENLRLGAVERDCTVLFSDLRGFTSFAEQLPAARVIEVVNCYLGEMTEAILGAGGTLIAYMGDGIMAVFGAPLEQPDHADRALAAAREMIGPRLSAFNRWIAEQGHGHRFVMGVGINSGSVMAGNIGSEQRVEYTALGDTTNTASRLEGMTKDSGHMLFVADSTRERLQNPPGDLVLVGELEVRGRVAAVPVWTIAAAAALAPAAADAAAPDRAAPPEDRSVAPGLGNREHPTQRLPAR